MAEWSKAAGCKPAGMSYGGSNPPSPNRYIAFDIKRLTLVTEFYILKRSHVVFNCDHMRLGFLSEAGVLLILIVSVSLCVFDEEPILDFSD